MKALLSLLAALAPWTVWAGAAGGPTGTIPEPSTIALLAAGAVGVALAARRRR
ncbi:PEP-CTERM sorting domain-containing protein [Inmirania thermothiophila]|uniref:Putative secreted protein with PEP-CTERM sorting signal n=1 Tax=Inmirania thermothiophila TaxID=1750597 RepID=A0A3N1XS78_9GAMM|nr:PEP-CTERM sorting domain-containing protein [Inmirania thermothiophila]ROR29509.1 putative secreted protein with PEP-CTERM sorting signal [Inmirania thermothiophila]